MSYKSNIICIFLDVNTEEEETQPEEKDGEEEEEEAEEYVFIN